MNDVRYEINGKHRGILDPGNGDDCRKIPALNTAIDVGDTAHIGNEGMDRDGYPLDNRYVVRRAHLDAIRETSETGTAISIISKYRKGGEHAVPHTGGSTQ